MPSVLRSALIFSFASALAVVAMPGCSQQGEGERCDSVKSGNEDCESGLTCIPQGMLLENTADRCCPPEGIGNDKRCIRGTGTTTTGGTSAGGTSASGGTEAGTTSSGGSKTETGGSASTGGTTDASGAGGALDSAGANGG